MVIGEQGLDDSQNQNIGTIQQTETPEGPTSESLELMESIIQRLQPTDRHDIREMISFRGFPSYFFSSWIDDVISFTASRFLPLTINELSVFIVHKLLLNKEC